MRQRANLWAVVLAGGEGSRIARLTTDRNGRTVPKQFWNMHDGGTMLEWTLNRAGRHTDPTRIVALVSDQQRQWWQPCLRPLLEENVLSQPENRGYGQLHIMFRRLENLRQSRTHSPAFLRMTWGGGLPWGLLPTHRVRPETSRGTHVSLRPRADGPRVPREAAGGDPRAPGRPARGAPAAQESPARDLPGRTTERTARLRNPPRPPIPSGVSPCHRAAALPVECVSSVSQCPVPSSPPGSCRSWST
jgi:hypothetical protein